MSKQKVRGLKRKTKNIIAQIESHTREFPDDFTLILVISLSEFLCKRAKELPYNASDYLAF